MAQRERRLWNFGQLRSKFVVLWDKSVSTITRIYADYGFGGRTISVSSDVEQTWELKMSCHVSELKYLLLIQIDC